MFDTQQIKGCCPLDCQDTCGWVAHVREGRVIAQGPLRAWVHVTEDIQAGAVALPGKWWGEATANLLTPSSWSPGGQPAYNDTFVEVSPTLLRSPTLSE